MLGSIFGFFSDKIMVILGTLLALSIVGNVYLNYRTNSLQNELAYSQMNISLLNETIEKQNRAIKDMEASTQGLNKELNDISSKYQEILFTQQENVEDFSKKNNISINESKLIIEKNKIQRGLDAFFKKH